MHRLVVLVVILTLPGCFLFFDEHGSGGDDCLIDVPNTDFEEPSQPPPSLRNPEDLQCQSFGGGGDTCDPNCGPCPLVGSEVALAPIPSWGICDGFCDTLDEASCAANDSCRVIKDARCAVEGTCETDFVMCAAMDQFVDKSIDCTTITDGQRCSQNPSCTAFHRESTCPRHDSPVPPPCTRAFAFCGDEGIAPGKCFEQAICDRLPPNCPSGTTPGVANGCFTDVCIPDDLCELAPDA